MIRINLLGERKKARITFKAPTGPPKSSFLIILFLGVFTVAGGYLYWRYQALTSMSTELSRQLAEAERDKAYRQKLLKEIEVFENRKRTLEAKIDVINELKKNQLGPVQWLNALGDAVDKTPSVWLTSVSQNAEHLSLEGIATSLKGVADFASVLQNSGAFKNVSINESAETNVSGLAGYTFSITCDTIVKLPSSKS